jgi:hypothetical protein
VGQVRLDSINLVGELGGRGAAPVTGFTPVTPFFTAGVRILDTRLFIGAGIGFAGVSQEVAGGDVGRFSFSLSPVASFDFISNDSAALYGIGMLNLISVGESETEPNGPGNSTNNGDDGFGLGLNAGVGIRGKLTSPLASPRSSAGVSRTSPATAATPLITASGPASSSKPAPAFEPIPRRTLGHS